MKNNFKLIFVVLIIFAIGFISNIDSTGAIEAKYFRTYLDCQSSANTNSTFTCDILASTDVDTNISSVTFDNLTNLKVVKKTLDTSINKADGKVSVGTVTVKVGDSDADATISAKVIPTVGNVTIKKSSPEVIRVISGINTLKSLKVDGVVVSGFSKDVTTYKVLTKDKSIKISASATSSSATVSGTGLKSLNCGTNTFKVIVKAATGSKKTYTLSVNRQCDTKVYLAGIDVSKGKLSPAFNKNVTAYTLNLDKAVEKITITGKKSNDTQKVTGNVKDYALKEGTNKVSITVSNNSGEKVVYTINVVRGESKEGNTYLSTLSLSSGNITFNKNTFEYETKVLYNVRNIEVLATPEKNTSKATVVGADGLIVGENIIKITVTADSGATKDYIVKVTRLKEGESFGDNANIKNIIIKGYKKDFKFEYNKLSYNLVIKDEKALDITVVMDDPNSTYRIIDNSNLKDGSMIKIETTSADGTSKTYTINIIKKSSAPYVVLFVVLILIAGGIVTYAYVRYARKKKDLLDANGYKINKENNQKPSMPQNVLTKHAAKKKNLDAQVISANKPVANYVADQKSVSKPELDNKVVEELKPQNGIEASSNKCPNCGRELLGSPEVCPYCNNKLK